MTSDTYPHFIITESDWRPVNRRLWQTNLCRVPVRQIVLSDGTSTLNHRQMLQLATTLDHHIELTVERFD